MRSQKRKRGGTVVVRLVDKARFKRGQQVILEAEDTEDPSGESIAYFVAVVKHVQGRDWYECEDIFPDNRGKLRTHFRERDQLLEFPAPNIAYARGQHIYALYPTQGSFTSKFYKAIVHRSHKPVIAGVVQSDLQVIFDEETEPTVIPVDRIMDEPDDRFRHLYISEELSEAEYDVSNANDDQNYQQETQQPLAPIKIRLSLKKEPEMKTEEDVTGKQAADSAVPLLEGGKDKEEKEPSQIESSVGPAVKIRLASENESLDTAYPPHQRPAIASEGSETTLSVEEEGEKEVEEFESVREGEPKVKLQLKLPLLSLSLENSEKEEKPTSAESHHQVQYPQEKNKNDLQGSQKDDPDTRGGGGDGVKLDAMETTEAPSHSATQFSLDIPPLNIGGGDEDIIQAKPIKVSFVPPVEKKLEIRPFEVQKFTAEEICGRAGGIFLHRVHTSGEQRSLPGWDVTMTEVEAENEAPEVRAGYPQTVRFSCVVSRSIEDFKRPFEIGEKISNKRGVYWNIHEISTTMVRNDFPFVLEMAVNVQSSSIARNFTTFVPRNVAWGSFEQCNGALSITFGPRADGKKLLGLYSPAERIKTRVAEVILEVRFTKDVANA